jgi:hypothetical protein
VDLGGPSQFHLLAGMHFQPLPIQMQMVDMTRGAVTVISMGQEEIEARRNHNLFIFGGNYIGTRPNQNHIELRAGENTHVQNSKRSRMQGGAYIRGGGTLLV